MKRPGEHQRTTHKSADSNLETKPAAKGHGMLIPLKVAYLIYVLPIMVLVGILFLLNARYAVVPSSTLLCITFPLLLSVLLISLISIAQYWRDSRN